MLCSNYYMLYCILINILLLMFLYYPLLYWVDQGRGKRKFYNLQDHAGKSWLYIKIYK